MATQIIVGDALASLRGMESESAQCCVTSPPYWGLRDYGVHGQLGLEPTPTEYVAAMVAVFAEVRRVLRPDGTLWLNVGDSYSSGGRTTQCVQTVRGQVVDNKSRPKTRTSDSDAASGKHAALNGTAVRPGVVEGLSGKQLIGIPWRLAFALQADGWFLRSDIIWSKPNPMPESVTDRPTKAHEYLFLLSRFARYYYDAEAIAEPSINAGAVVTNASDRMDGMAGRENQTRTGFKGSVVVKETRNARSVWTVQTRPFPEAHFATFPPELPRRCILAGSRVGDTVLDPFAGAGTTLLVADRLQRHAVGIELNPKYAAMADRRIRDDAPLFMDTLGTSPAVEK